MDFIDLKPIQLTTPDDTRLTYAWLVEAENKYPPARWQVTAVIPNSPRAIEIGEQLDTYNLNFKKALKAALYKLESHVIRGLIVEGTRPDGRKPVSYTHLTLPTKRIV